MLMPFSFKADPQRIKQEREEREKDRQRSKHIASCAKAHSKRKSKKK